MSKIALTPDASGTGTFTIASPNSNTSRALTLPDGDGTVATAESTLAQFNASGSAPVYACRAWVNFNGTGAVAIRSSGNISSITDSGTGDYTVNFSTALADDQYAFVGSASGNTTVPAFDISHKNGDTKTSSAFRLYTGWASNTTGLQDVENACITFWR